ncbi:HepT-like ribonuclease domain-containing protein [Marivirga arenosa]|uniref:Uncharacterized protein n=1 Tax=Marivirga arenosa TaxID=3059076 RepID=A0AA49GBF2_9BACT|nr:HepT-like ribonuclease domain-containing protein [Marivirga sp. BKB1-2]WKK79251.2 hypothetical protein QYS47_17585 [Marivirga sp. BKB1-2]
MMQLQETVQHLNRIVDNIAQINAQTDGMTYEDFRKNETVKETVYEYLQEIGQAARELSENQKLPAEINIEPLVAFRNARYNQEAETAHQQVFNVLADLRNVAETIEQSDLYQNNLS